MYCFFYVKKYVLIHLLLHQKNLFLSMSVSHTLFLSAVISTGRKLTIGIPLSGVHSQSWLSDGIKPLLAKASSTFQSQFLYSDYTFQSQFLHFDYTFQSQF